MLSAVYLSIPSAMLFSQEESHQRPFVSNIINRLANYDGGVVPQFEGDDEDGDPNGKTKKKKNPPRVRKNWKQ